MGYSKRPVRRSATISKNRHERAGFATVAGVKMLVDKSWALLMIGASAILALFSPPATAQSMRVDEAVEITSDRSEYLRNEGVGVATGNVVATQNNGRLTTDKLTIVCTKTVANAAEDKPSCESMEQLVADGNVLYVTRDVKIHGDRANYDYRTDTLTVTGNVILARGTEGLVRGNKVVYKVDEGRTVVTADTDRVKTFLIPTKKAQVPATPPPPN